MNKDQAAGAAKKIGGKVQQEVGKLVGSKQQQVEGIKHQIAGKMQETLGDVKAAVKKSQDGK